MRYPPKDVKKRSDRPNLKLWGGTGDTREKRDRNLSRKEEAPGPARKIIETNHQDPAVRPATQGKNPKVGKGHFAEKGDIL